MNDVSVNNPNLKLVSRNDQLPARVSASSQAESSNASARVTPIESARGPQTIAAKPLSAEGLQTEIRERAKELKETVSQLNQYVQSLHRSLEFQVDNESGQTVVKVVDKETDKVIRQIPDELAMRLAEKLQQDEPLTLLNIEV